MVSIEIQTQARNYLARLPLKIKSVAGIPVQVGQYRVIYTRQDDRLIEIVKIRPRGDVSENARLWKMEK